MMLYEQNYSRVDALKMRTLIIRKIGHQRAEKYFDHLGRLFSLKISKSEFDKFCTQIMGKENVPLHNHLIRLIVKNACLAKIPPSKGFRKVKNSLDSRTSNGSQKSSIQSLHGETYPLSPYKGRFSVSRDRRFPDVCSSLHSLGNQEGVAFDKVFRKIQEQQSATELHSLGSRPPVENASVEDGEEVEQVALSPGVQSGTPVTAPLGVFEASKDAQASLSNASLHSNFMRTCQSTGELPNTRLLRSCLQQKLKKECVGISSDCVDLLNIGLDTYLKRLIEHCLGIASSMSSYSDQNQVNGQATLDGDLPESSMTNSTVNTSMLTFQAALELNPRILGPDWAIQLEKICSIAYEE